MRWKIIIKAILDAIISFIFSFIFVILTIILVLYVIADKESLHISTDKMQEKIDGNREILSGQQERVLADARQAVYQMYTCGIISKETKINNYEKIDQGEKEIKIET